jgi:peptide/nickel transport system substrate-binding protein
MFRSLLKKLSSISLLICILVIATVPSRVTAQTNQDSRASLLTVAMPDEGLSDLDPAIVLGSSMLVMSQIYDTLTAYSSANAILGPSLATSWSVSADQLDWTFNLRSNVKFHDGSNFTSSVVKYNFERWWDPAHPFHGSYDYSYLNFFFRPKDDPAGSVLKGIETNGDLQVIFHLNEPLPNMPYILAIPSFSIASQQAIQSGNLATSPCGTGPYKFTEWNKTSNYIQLTQANSWSPALHFSDVRFEFYASSNSQLNAVTTGHAQMAYELPNALYDQIKTNPNLSPSWTGFLNTGYVGLNTSKAKLSNLKVRQAIAYALDKEKLFGQAYDPMDSPATQFLPSEMWGYNTALKGYGYDPTLARQLLSEAGYPNGFSISLQYRDVSRVYMQHPVAAAQEIQRQLAVVGITVNLQLLPTDQFLNNVENGDVEMFLIGWGADYPHPNNFLAPVLCENLHAAFGAKNDTFCNNLKTTLSKPDVGEQTSDYEAYELYLQDTWLPLIPLATGHILNVLDSSVAGLEKSWNGGENLETIFLVSGQNTLLSPVRENIIKVEQTENTPSSITVPIGAIEGMTVLVYSQNNASLQSADTASALAPFTNRPITLKSDFTLTAFKSAIAQNAFTFQKPVDYAIHYGPYAHLVKPGSLALMHWTGSGWEAAQQTCAAPKVPNNDLVNHILTTSICQTGTFGVYGEINPGLNFLPLLTK